MTNLKHLRIAPPLSMTGYERDCGPKDGCVFGPSWSDDVDVAGGRNGCDTRSDILRRDAIPGTTHLESGTHGCKVETGRWKSPYTGTIITQRRLVQIDHVVPEAAAWRSGAREWSQTRRTNYANDPRVLLAADAHSNLSKGDDGPDQWRPTLTSAWCPYAIRWITIKHLYGLTITSAEHDALLRMLNRCS